MAKRKNKAAQALRRRGIRKLGPERRSEIASVASKARWANLTTEEARAAGALKAWETKRRAARRGRSSGAGESSPPSA